MRKHLTNHHATAFLDRRGSRPVEELRSGWDPVMAGQIAAHITFIYPEEIPDRAELERRAAAAAARTPHSPSPWARRSSPAHPQTACSFTCTTRTTASARSARMRSRPAARSISPPHVTIAHPRTSSLGQQAWERLAASRIDVWSAIHHVVITASSGDSWQTLQRLPLAGTRRPR